jgi:hypothetical protein
MSTTSSTSTKVNLKHEHTCVKCGEKYTHSHPAKDANHEQFAHQCPNPACEWYPGLGSPKNRPDTWNSDGEKFVWPRAAPTGDVPTKPARTETARQKSVRIAYNQDKINCPNADHFRFHHPAGEKYPSLQKLEPKYILQEMTPFKAASCPCERAACRAAWEFNDPGVLQSEFVARGNYFKGVGEVKGHPKTVIPVAFRLSKEQFDHLHACFPDYHFHQYKSDGHDHPISHVKTQVAAYEMLLQFRRKGKKIIDIHGNPASNANMKRILGLDVTTFVTLVTAKDHIRAATKWAASEFKEVPYIRDLHTSPEVLELMSKADAMVSVHTAYYYGMNEVVGMMKLMKDKATFTCIMHKFQGAAGSLNEGELVWKKVGRTIHQTNARTGESYSHPDNSAWFEKGCWAVETRAECAKRGGSSAVDGAIRDALAWTSTEVCPGVYRFLAVLVPRSVVWNEEASQGGLDLAPPADIPVKITLGPLVKDFAIPAQFARVYDECRKTIANRERTEKKWQAHVSTVRSKMNAFWSEHKIECDADTLAVIQFASFWDGFTDQALEAITLNTAGQFITSAHSRSVNGTHLLGMKNLLTMTCEIVGHVADARGAKTVKAASGVLASVLGRV